MGLVDRARAADHGGEAGLLEQAALGRETDGLGAVGAGQQADQRLGRRLPFRDQRRDLRARVRR